MGNTIGPVQPAKDKSECESTWEWLYHTYRVLERRWDRLYGSSEIEFSDDDKFRRYSKLLDLLKKPDPQGTISEFRAAGALAEIDQTDIDLALELRESIAEHAEMEDSSHELLSGSSSPYDDAYHAALKIDLGWTHGSTDLNFYRGQRDETWDLLPSIYRDIETYHYPERSSSIINERLTELSRFVTEIDRFLNDTEYPAYGEDELVAIAQHFHQIRSGSEPGPRSWLLDVTSDPLVALYFATAPDETDSLGVIYQFRRSWVEREIPFITDESGVRLIVPAGIPRIQRQEAAFLELHPIILNQYHTRQLRFEQKAGLEFIDPYLGITKNRLLNANDPLLGELKLGRLQYLPLDANEAEDTSPPSSLSEFDVTLTPVSITPPSWLETGNRELHREIVREFAAQYDTAWEALPSERQDALNYIADYHAYLQEYDFDGSDDLVTSINRFRGAVKRFCGQLDQLNEPLCPFTESVLESEYGQYFSGISATVDETLTETLQAFEKDWETPMQSQDGE